ncbi:Alpha-enolase [Microtus ochrogaster]|uniref:phosphopyruvate hydratase n=1 Tax=Microtus ochrogaster TaxID=79684 RepID=A0A8J6L2T1_MICOH|nr:Alpha-enolase [Microtus ochrogaster]
MKYIEKAAEHINKTTALALVIEIFNVVQQKINKLIIGMDGSENKSKFDTNVILVVSLVICKTSDFGKGMSQYCHITDLADKSKVILPVLVFNIINKGSHAGSKLSKQEVMILLVDASSI